MQKLLLLIFFISCISCNTKRIESLDAKEQRLEAKEQELNDREQELDDREENLAQTEQDYKAEKETSDERFAPIRSPLSKIESTPAPAIKIEPVNHKKFMYVSIPTWENHVKLMSDGGHYFTQKAGLYVSQVFEYSDIMNDNVPQEITDFEFSILMKMVDLNNDAGRYDDPNRWKSYIINSKRYSFKTFDEASRKQSLDELESKSRNLPNILDL